MLSREEVLKIAHLARLELTENEVTEYQKRLGRVIDYMKDLDELNLQSELGSIRHVPEDARAFRDDVPIQFPNRDQLLKNAPQLDGSQYLLPTVVEKET